MFQKLVLIGAIALASLALAAKLPSSNPETFIVGGRNATPNEFPWLVRFTVLDAAGDSRFCTGALIALNVVLTSASCVRDNSRPITVVAGDHLLLEDDGTEVSIASQEVTLHEDFNSTSLENDIALIHLSSSFQQNAAIQPVQLPNATDDPEASGYAFIAGWGETSLAAEEEGTLSAILRTAEVIVSTGNFVCEALYGISLPEGQFCTSGSGGAKGDRGAPLICHSTKNVTCGILSHTWLDISGLRTNVGGWVKVNEYVDWILQHL